VLQAIESKRSLFGSVFDGDSDSVDFAALGTPSFLDGVRDVIDVEKPAPVPEPEAQAKVVAGVGLLEANVHMLEALAAWDEDAAWTPDLRDRAGRALRKLLERIEGV
jgi:hypothetical protein